MASDVDFASHEIENDSLDLNHEKMTVFKALHQTEAPDVNQMINF